ncbi:MAG: asparagine synthase (glutamine-hydrolyzing) [Proteobacteria bacterium]|nr:asparagine synthase (glutamine-hydrolyzing) [Pseudomonadota bacterium]MDA1059061.1 asparagine synthase (glutamine-hydrolyzing) [Pseudomonadota bacterium]
MCGVAGIFNIDGAPVSPVVLGRMTDMLAHRGPDDRGTHVDGALGLGHRRLSIIDLSAAGHQPMATPDGRYVLSYNGEVYNFAELRTELESAGFRFRSRTDSEVVLYAFAHWGLAAVERFNGMFALALWDATERRLHLVRDRYGVKPLYYCRAGGALLFASEAKAFLAHPDFSPNVGTAGLVEYLTFQNYFTDRTLLDGVRVVEPGTIVALSEGRETPEVRRYWDYAFVEPDQHASEADLVDELDRLFTQAVGRQLVSDVPVGAYLSGGIDSGSITAIAAQQLPLMSTFTVGFDLNSASGIELAYDERESAEHMSYLFRTQQYEMVLKAGDMERAMRQLVWHIEEPRVGQSYPNYYAARLASRFAKVVLAGTGGDELFGGYPWRYYRGAVASSFDEYTARYYEFWQRLVPGEDMQALLGPLGSDAASIDTRQIFRDVFQEHAPSLTRPEDYINHSMYFEAKTFLHGLLVVDDKLSMAHSLETRVPFLDNDLVDFAMNLPAAMKLDNLQNVVQMNENEPGKVRQYFARTKDGKLLLRKAMARHVPASVSEREKQGFSGPDASWFRGESIDYVRDLLMSPRARIYDLLDRPTVTRLVNDHLEGRQNRRLLIWSLLSLENWLEIFAHGRWEAMA